MHARQVSYSYIFGLAHERHKDIRHIERITSSGTVFFRTSHRRRNRWWQPCSLLFSGADLSRPHAPTARTETVGWWDEVVGCRQRRGRRMDVGLLGRLVVSASGTVPGHSAPGWLEAATSAILFAVVAVPFGGLRCLPTPDLCHRRCLLAARLLPSGCSHLRECWVLFGLSCPFDRSWLGSTRSSWPAWWLPGRFGWRSRWWWPSALLVLAASRSCLLPF